MMTPCADMQPKSSNAIISNAATVEQMARNLSISGSLSWDHLRMKGHPNRDNPDFIVTACNFCNTAANNYFEHAAERGLKFDGMTPEELVAQRPPYVLQTRQAYWKIGKNTWSRRLHNPLLSPVRPFPFRKPSHTSHTSSPPPPPPPPAAPSSQIPTPPAACTRPRSADSGRRRSIPAPAPRSQTRSRCAPPRS